MPPTISHASVDSCETVRISLKMLASNNMSVKTADIMNTYIKAPCRENMYTILGPEFVPYERNMVIIV